MMTYAKSARGIFVGRYLQISIWIKLRICFLHAKTHFAENNKPLSLNGMFEGVEQVVGLGGLPVRLKFWWILHPNFHTDR